MGRKPEDLTGQKFGDLVVVEMDLKIPGKSGKHKKWICQCKCGNCVSVDSHRLKNGERQSCGECRKINVDKSQRHEYLRQLQSLPLEAKINKTKTLIREWYEYYDGQVYVSFSGGKDSTVLLHIAREIYPDIKAMFCDTGLEFPQIRRFVNTFENVDILHPKLSFKQVIKRDGYPIISKEVAQCIKGARRFFNDIADDYGTYVGLGNYRKNPKLYEEAVLDKNNKYVANWVYAVKLLGMLKTDRTASNDITERSQKSRYNYKRYAFTLDAPFEISSSCCNVLKKNQIKTYYREKGANGITAQMASESSLRESEWIKHGCNGYMMKHPVGNPMAFWTEQDVLQYIYDKKLTICSVYGSVIRHRNSYSTTGCNRTGCFSCGFGLHLESKNDSRFKIMNSYVNQRLTDAVLRGGWFDQNTGWWTPHNGIGLWFIIEWMNRHGKESGLKIWYPNREKYLDEYMTEEIKSYLL